MSIFSEHFEEEITHLNRLLDDSNLTISCLFQLLRDHNVPVGSTELIKAREKVEAEREALKLKVLELSADAARVRCSHKNKEKLYPDEIETLRTTNAGLVEKVASLEKQNARLQAGGCARDQRTTQFCAEAVALAEKVRRLEDALEIAVGRSHAKTLISIHVDREIGQP